MGNPELILVEEGDEEDLNLVEEGDEEDQEVGNQTLILVEEEDFHVETWHPCYLMILSRFHVVHGLLATIHDLMRC